MACMCSAFMTLTACGLVMPSSSTADTLVLYIVPAKPPTVASGAGALHIHAGSACGAAFGVVAAFERISCRSNITCTVIETTRLVCVCVALL